MALGSINNFGGFGRGNPDVPGQVIAQSRQNTVGGQSMRYPSEHGRFFTIMDFVEYKRTNPKTQATRVDQADVVLPLPMNLREYYSIHYADVAFNNFGGAANEIEKYVNQYLAGGGLNMDKIGDTVTGLSQALARNTLGYISDDLSGLIDRFAGNIVNPHVTAVFRGVAPREHVLQWRFTPRSAAESTAVRGIINYIRERMHPEKKNEFLLNFPDEVYVTFYADARPFLYPIFKSVVTGIDTNLSSEGTNAFFRGTDEPVVIDMTVTLKEVETLTREDFGSRGDGQTNNAETPTAPNGEAVGA